MKKYLTPVILMATLLVSCVTEEQDEKTASTDTVATSATDTPSVQATAPEAAYVYGIDISKYQGDEIDFLDKKQDSITFVICKATQGLTITDPDFANNWNTIRSKGFLRGAYHFYQTQDDPEKQAQFFLSVVDSFASQNFPPIIDFEEASISSSLTTAQIQNNLLAFLKAVEQGSGRRPIIYTDNNTGNRYLTTDAFANYPLFIADYNNTSTPALPGAWKNRQWALWQKSENYMLNSVQDDFDMFNGGLQQLQLFISNH